MKGTLVINPALQNLQPFPTIPNIVGDFSTVQPFNITPPSSSSTNPVIVTVKSGPAMISNNMVTLTGNGVVVLSATQVASSNYLAATPVTTSFSVGRASQSLVGNFNVPGQSYGVSPFGVTLPQSVDGSNNATGLPVTLSVLSGPATVKGTNVTVTGAGVVTLAANQAGNNTFGPAAQMTTSFTVSQATNAIASFASIPSKVYGAAPFKVIPPVASSGLPVSLSVLSGPATIAGNTVTVTGVGTVTLAADQGGNANYSSATQVTTSFSVQPASQSITFAKPATQTYGAQPISLSATSTSALPVTFSTSDTNVVSISGNIVTILRAGTATITARQSGNDNYAAATNVGQSLVINPAAQTISLSVPNTVTYISNGTVQLAAQSSSGLPVTFNLKSGPARLTGNTLTLTGKGAITVTAVASGNGNYQTATQNFTITSK